LPGFCFSLWFALWAPKSTPEDIIARLNDAVVNTLAEPSMDQKSRTRAWRFRRAQQTTEALEAVHRAEIEKWWPVTKAAGIKGE
jgi:tripartite-type tricarboxylate transporter receptor subunit TctC